MINFFLKDGEETTPDKADYAVELEWNDDGTVKSSKWYFPAEKMSEESKASGEA